MNERTKLLAEQAGLQQRTWRSLGRDLPMWQEDPDNPGLAKFAELIVRECADFIEQDQGAGEVLSNRLKKHFGVEE